MGLDLAWELKLDGGRMGTAMKGDFVFEYLRAGNRDAERQRERGTEGGVVSTYRLCRAKCREEVGTGDGEASTGSCTALHCTPSCACQIWPSWPSTVDQTRTCTSTAPPSSPLEHLSTLHTCRQPWLSPVPDLTHSLSLSLFLGLPADSSKENSATIDFTITVITQHVAVVSTLHLPSSRLPSRNITIRLYTCHAMPFHAASTELCSQDIEISTRGRVVLPV